MVVVGALILGLFVLELQVPINVEVWLPNVAVVLLSFWFPHRWQTYLTTLICSVVTILGLFLSPNVGDLWVAVINRFLGIAVFWIINLVNSQVEVYSQPRAGKNPGYRQRKDYSLRESVPLILDGREIAKLAVRDLIPL